MIPKWVQELTIQTMIYLQGKGYKAELPDITWRKSSYHQWSSGTCYQHDHITITAGKLRKDQKVVLLHELAHWVMPDEEHHGDNFWKLAFELYRWQKLSIRYCVNRESNNTQRRSYKRIKKLSKRIGVPSDD